MLKLVQSSLLGLGQTIRQNRTVKPAVSIILAAILCSACASSLDRFRLTPIPVAVEFASCDLLAERVQQVEERRMTLVKFFKSHTMRLLGGLFGPFMAPLLLTLEGEDGPRAEEYRSLLGEYISLAKLNEEQECDVDFRLPLT